MTLVVDHRAELTGQPGLHVLIIGVSAYRHLPGGSGPEAAQSFGLKQLSSTAISAFRFYQWLREAETRFPVPLSTCRLLLGPSQVELDADPTMRDLAAEPTLEAVLEAADAWREDAAGHKDGMTLFYFAGHGVQRTNEDSVLILSDFGKGGGGALRCTIDTGSLYFGMAPSAIRPNLALRQIFVVDACRNFPAAFANFEQLQTTAVFDISLDGTRDSRQAPMFFGAVPGSTAQGIRGKETLFTRALLQGLRGGAARPDDDTPTVWGVGVHSLTRALKVAMRDLNVQFGADQEVTTSRDADDVKLVTLAAPPPVEVTVAVDPPDALTCTRVELLSARNRVLQSLPVPLAPHPFTLTLPPGTYGLRAVIDPPHPEYEEYTLFRQLMPPSTPWIVEVDGE